MGAVGALAPVLEKAWGHYPHARDRCTANISDLAVKSLM